MTSSPSSLCDETKVLSPPRALWETHTIWTSAPNARNECWMWTGPYRNVSHSTSTPILYYDNSRFSARVVVAAAHGLCHFTDNIMVQMTCKNTHCVAPHHMRLTQRLPRFRATPATKRKHSSVTQTEDCDESISVTPHLSVDVSPMPKRARIDSELDGKALSETNETFPLSYLPVATATLPPPPHVHD